MSDAGVLYPGRRARAVPLRLRSDERLARQSANGDTDAFAALYERHHRSLYRYCRSIVADPDDAADALQSTMTRALASIGGRDEAAPVRAWLFRIAHNESISVIRRRRTAEPLEPDTAIGPDVAADAELRGRLSQLVADLQVLTERQRSALVMRELSGLSHVEIAAALEVSVGAVKQSIFEARTALHDLAAGREMECVTVQRQLSDGDGRTARSRPLRAHLRSCAACSAFRDSLKARSRELAMIAPVLPAATAAAVLEGVIGGGGGAGGGGLLAGLLGGGISKTVAVGAATVTAGAGTATYTATRPDEPQRERGTTAAGTPAPKPPPAGAVLPAAIESSEGGWAESRTVVATNSAPKPSERRAAKREAARGAPRDRPAKAQTTPPPADRPEPREREQGQGQTTAPDAEGREDEQDEVAEYDDDAGAGSRGRSRAREGNDNSAGGKRPRPGKSVKVKVKVKVNVPAPESSGGQDDDVATQVPVVSTPAPDGEGDEAVRPTPVKGGADGLAGDDDEDVDD